MKIVISGIFYPFTMMSYFLRAFERRNDIEEIITVGPYTEDWIPWNGGMRIPQRYIHTPTYPLSKHLIGNNSITSGFVKALLKDKADEIDLWLQIDAGWHFVDRPPGKVVAHVQTDPHVLKQTYGVPKSYSDFSFCMQQAYLMDGERYLPYAYDPTVHFYEELPKVYDACLVGILYHNRNDLITRLRNRGLTVYHSIGAIYEEYRLIYNKSHIALSWSSLDDTPARVWEAMGMKMPLVCNRTPDLPTFFVDGEHYLGFDTLDEAEKQVMRLMIDPDFMQEIADAGHRKVLPHTWDNRVNQLLEVCKLI